MSVYVDDMRRPANLTGRPARWSHLMADTHDELMQAALDLGLRDEWIQHEGTHREHFDVTETVRQRAIAAGVAKPIPYPRGTGELMARKRAALTSDTAGGASERDRERADWSSWLDGWLSAVGPKPPTVEDVARALREGPRPFGVARSDSGVTP